MLGDRIEQVYRLTCQLWITHDIELIQEDPATDASRQADTPVAAASDQ